MYLSHAGSAYIIKSIGTEPHPETFANRVVCDMFLPFEGGVHDPLLVGPVQKENIDP